MTFTQILLDLTKGHISGAIDHEMQHNQPEKGGPLKRTSSTKDIGNSKAQSAHHR